VPRPPRRRFTLRQTALRVAHHRLSYLDPGARGEALLAAESHVAGYERQRPRGYVRLRQLAVRGCRDRNGPTADAARRSQLPLRKLVQRRLRGPACLLIG